MTTSVLRRIASLLIAFVVLGGVYGCRSSVGEPTKHPLHDLTEWEQHRKLVRQELRAGRHAQLFQSYEAARKIKDSAMLRAGQGSVLAWWTHLYSFQIDPVSPPLRHDFLDALEKEGEKSEDPNFLLALYQLDEAIFRYPPPEDHETRIVEVVVNGKKRKVEQYVFAKHVGRAKRQRLRRLAERIHALAPDDPRVQILWASYVEDPQAKLKLLEKAYGSDGAALGILSVATIIDAAKAAHRKDVERTFRKELERLLISEQGTPQAKYLSLRRRDLVASRGQRLP